ncbi:hypothetical protein C8R46DRAFT_276154 [Mycena filopes]|nr:hypothetical protein C8R46DRAFT_276154 [Mycena filopes]
MSKKLDTPIITDVYHSGARLKLYEPESVPDLPQMKYAGEPYCDWPHPHFSDSDYQQICEAPLQMCYERDIPYNATSPATTLELTRPLAVGNRDTRLAQVWQAIIPGSATLLVARMYDPLYFATEAVDRFLQIDRAVAVEHEVYQRLSAHQGTLVPKFRGLFVAEIPCFDRPRHIYAVLLEYIDGKDLQETMADDATADVCALHRASLINDVARVAYPLYNSGLHLDDLMDRNTVVQLPDGASQEDFCAADGCPWRHRLRIDVGNDLILPAHPHAPRIFLIDLENVCFRDFGRSLSVIRECILSEWYVLWLWPYKLLPLYEPDFSGPDPAILAALARLEAEELALSDAEERNN